MLIWIWNHECTFYDLQYLYLDIFFFKNFEIECITGNMKALNHN